MKTDFDEDLNLDNPNEDLAREKSGTVDRNGSLLPQHLMIDLMSFWQEFFATENSFPSSQSNWGRSS